MSEEQLEVVKVSPSTALDRALLKEKKKHQHQRKDSHPNRQENDYLNINTATTNANDLLESQGQELLWIEDGDKDNVNNTKKGSGLLGSFRSSKSLPQQIRFYGRHKNSKPKETTARVVVVADPAQKATATTTATMTSTNTTTNDRLHQAAAKAQEARDLLDQALVPLHSPIERNNMLRKAFSTAVEARILVDPNLHKESKNNAKRNNAYHELEQSKSLGEEEALEASRIISIMSGQQHLVDGTEESKPKQRRKHARRAATPVNHCSQSTSLPFDTLLKLANQHAEAARQYLESMLPFFQDQAEEDAVYCRSQSNRNVTNNRDSQIISSTPNNEYDHAAQRPGNNMPQEIQAGIPNVVIDEETKRRAAERHAAIARGVQQNNTMPSLGFDNTFQNGDTISTLGFDNTFQNEDSLTINSLNAFLDAPMSGTAENSLGKAVPDQPNSGGGEVAPNVENPEHQLDAPILSIGPACEKVPSTGKQRESKFGLFRRNKTTKVQHKKGRRTTKVDRFIPTTITPVCDDEQDGFDPETRQQLVHIQDIERVTGDRLQAAMQKTQAAAKANAALILRGRGHGLGEMGVNDPATRGVYYRDPTMVRPHFVDAPKIPPGILNQKSWEDLADGASLEDVTSLPDATSLPDQTTENKLPIKVPARASSFVHLRRFGLFGRKSSKGPRLQRATETNPQKKESGKEVTDKDDYISPPSWPEVVGHGATAATSGEDPADDHAYKVIVLNGDDDNSSPTATYSERDRYAVLVDDQECQGTVDNEQDQQPATEPEDSMRIAPATVQQKGISGAFSWDAGKHGENAFGAKPSFVEVDGEDEAKLVLANKEEVLQSIEAPVRVQPTEDIKTIRSMTNDAEVGPTTSFMEQMAEAKQASAKQRAAAAAITPSPGRKKGLYQRWKLRPAQV